MEELRRLNTIWLERTNPLRGLSISRATSMFDAARVWGSPRLQYAYNEIEATDPVLMTCVERRQSALSGLGYRFVASSSEDETLANEQRDALDKFVNGIENFSEALEHMDLAFFRGFSHVQPIWDGPKVQHVNLLDSWNFLRNDAGQWLWNPACHETTGGLEPIGPDAQLVSLFRRRAIDYPALMIYIRHALGDRDWGRFIERYAIPPVHFEMAPGAEEKDKPLYQEAGDAAHNGQNTIRPNGSHIDFAAEARGADPFTPFIEHQDKYIVLLATGGTLTSLAQSDTGSLAGGAQMEVWREIVARDGVKIAEALNRSLFRRYLELEFPGQPVAARFELSNETKPTADEIADLAGKLKTAGYTVDQAELEEAVGLKLSQDKLSGNEAGGGMNLEQLASLIYPLKAAGCTIQQRQLEGATGLHLEPAADPTAQQPAAPIPNKQPVKSQETEDANLLTAFAKDMSPAGKAVAELLKNPSKEAAEKVLAGLDDLMPEDPAMAAILAEAMAKEFGAKVQNKESEGDVEFRMINGHPVPIKDGKPVLDGEHGERKIHAVKSSPKADAQANACGYKGGVKEMLEKAKSVPANRVTEIQEGFSGKCKAHEAIAVISEDKPFNDAEGNNVHFSNDIIEHYVEGKRRRDNEPKVANLEDIPYAIKAVKSDSYGVTRLKYPHGTTPDPLEPPRGTQREYHINTDRGQLKVFVYIQGGIINGWHVQDK